jgi:hypothetical protein
MKFIHETRTSVLWDVASDMGQMTVQMISVRHISKEVSVTVRPIATFSRSRAGKVLSNLWNYSLCARARVQLAPSTGLHANYHWPLASWHCRASFLYYRKQKHLLCLYIFLSASENFSRNLQSQSQSELLYDWRFTANQFVLATSPLRLTTK